MNLELNKVEMDQAMITRTKYAMIISGIILCCGLVTKTLCAEKYKNESPNIILLVADDQGYGDFGATGNPLIKTPHLDRLADQSFEMTRFYVPEEYYDLHESVFFKLIFNTKDLKEYGLQDNQTTRPMDNILCNNFNMKEIEKFL